MDRIFDFFLEDINRPGEAFDTHKDRPFCKVCGKDAWLNWAGTYSDYCSGECKESDSNDGRKNASKNRNLPFVRQIKQPVTYDSSRALKSVKRIIYARRVAKELGKRFKKLPLESFGAIKRCRTIKPIRVTDDEEKEKALEEYRRQLKDEAEQRKELIKREMDKVSIEIDKKRAELSFLGRGDREFTEEQKKLQEEMRKQRDELHRRAEKAVKNAEIEADRLCKAREAHLDKLAAEIQKETRQIISSFEAARIKADEDHQKRLSDIQKKEDEHRKRLSDMKKKEEENDKRLSEIQQKNLQLEKDALSRRQSEADKKERAIESRDKHLRIKEEGLSKLDRALEKYAERAGRTSVLPEQIMLENKRRRQKARENLELVITGLKQRPLHKRNRDDFFSRVSNEMPSSSPNLLFTSSGPSSSTSPAPPLSLGYKGTLSLEIGPLLSSNVLGKIFENDKIVYVAIYDNRSRQSQAEREEKAQCRTEEWIGIPIPSSETCRCSFNFDIPISFPSNSVATQRDLQISSLDDTVLLRIEVWKNSRSKRGNFLGEIEVPVLLFYDEFFFFQFPLVVSDLRGPDDFVCDCDVMVGVTFIPEKDQKTIKGGESKELSETTKDCEIGEERGGENDGQEAEDKIECSSHIGLLTIEIEGEAIHENVQPEEATKVPLDLSEVDSQTFSPPPPSDVNELIIQTLLQMEELSHFGCASSKLKESDCLSDSPSSYQQSREKDRGSTPPIHYNLSLLRSQRKAHFLSHRPRFCSNTLCGGGGLGVNDWGVSDAAKSLGHDELWERRFINQLSFPDMYTEEEFRAWGLCKCCQDLIFITPCNTVSNHSEDTKMRLRKKYDSSYTSLSVKSREEAEVVNSGQETDAFEANLEGVKVISPWLTSTSFPTSHSSRVENEHSLSLSRSFSFHEFSPLSFIPIAFPSFSVIWPTCRHLFEAQKFPYIDIQERIRCCASHEELSRVLKAKFLKYLGRRDWNEKRKVQCMDLCISLKIQQHPRLQLLLSMVKHPIYYVDGRQNDITTELEGKDNFSEIDLDGEKEVNEMWGLGESSLFCYNLEKKTGLNVVGKILMRRKEDMVPMSRPSCLQ